MKRLAFTSRSQSLWDISPAARHACLDGRVLITCRLWDRIAGTGAAFSALDYRLRELCWGFRFAQAGMSRSHTTRTMRGTLLSFTMVYDPPSTLQTVIASRLWTRNGRPALLFDAAAAPAASKRG